MGIKGSEISGRNALSPLAIHNKKVQTKFLETDTGRFCEDIKEWLKIKCKECPPELYPKKHEFYECGLGIIRKIELRLLLKANDTVVSAAQDCKKKDCKH